MNPLLAYSGSIDTFLDHVQALNPETSAAMLNAEFYLFFGGVFFAFALGAFSLVIRGTKGAASDVDL